MTTVYDVLRRPLLTEKSNLQVRNLHQMTFVVSPDATKTQVKDAVEKVFNVSVVRVNVINMPGKIGRKGKTRRRVVTREQIKKAVITLAPGQTIPFFEGVE